MDEIKLWCCVEGNPNYFGVSVTRSRTFDDLKVRIYEKVPQYFAQLRVDASDLRLTKVDVAFDDVEDIISAGKYRPLSDHQPLRPMDRLSNVWHGQPPDEHLHVFVGLPGGVGSPTLVYNRGKLEEISHVDHLQTYKDIFMKVNKWGTFEYSDIEKNQIECADYAMITPNFVTTFEQKLVRKPLLPHDMYDVWSVLQNKGLSGPYFELLEDSMTEDESHEKMRIAKPLEMFHISLLASFNWQHNWQPEGSSKRPLKGGLMDAFFFNPTVETVMNGTTTALRNKKWPISVVVTCEGVEQSEGSTGESTEGSNEEIRKYCPLSNFLVSNSSLPRLLVEVNSTSENSWPSELIRMLTTGAFIVRFANKFVRAFSQEKSFVLCAIFIWDNGDATRYTLYQQQVPNDEVVYYNNQDLVSLNEPVGRVDFVRHLYNLLGDEELDRDRDAKRAIAELHRTIADRGLKSMYIEDPRNPNEATGNACRKCACTGNGDRTGGENEDIGCAQLRAHGYEVKPEVIEDDSGGVWEPLFKMPDHILTVYRPMDSNTEFIAKEIREESNELEILRLLNTMSPKSDHVITLIDSFHGWAILPKVDTTIQYYVQFAPNKLKSKVPQVCLGLIKGIAYLHQHRIAHRDIKPDNLVVDRKFCVKIIDFDLAMRVEDSNEEVDDQCGHEDWMAPEVKKKLRHSPIKADRWACGRMLLFLLGAFGYKDESLRAFARNLVAHNPRQRPSLLLWQRYLAPRSSNVRKVRNSEATRARQDPVEVNGEDTNPRM